MIERWRQPVKQIVIFLVVIVALGEAGPLVQAQQSHGLVI
jgi:hypothetical protein